MSVHYLKRRSHGFPRAMVCRLPSAVRVPFARRLISMPARFSAQVSIFPLMWATTILVNEPTSVNHDALSGHLHLASLQGDTTSCSG
jgi:hypothetical protein